MDSTAASTRHTAYTPSATDANNSVHAERPQKKCGLEKISRLCDMFSWASRGCCVLVRKQDWRVRRCLTSALSWPWVCTTCANAVRHVNHKIRAPPPEQPHHAILVLTPGAQGHLPCPRRGLWARWWRRPCWACGASCAAVSAAPCGLCPATRRPLGTTRCTRCRRDTTGCRITRWPAHPVMPSRPSLSLPNQQRAHRSRGCTLFPRTSRPSMPDVNQLQRALRRANPNEVDVDATAWALVQGCDVAAIRSRWQPRAPSLAPPCRHCGAIGTVTITMQQLRSGDEAEEAVASCARCRRRYRVDL